MAEFDVRPISLAETRSLRREVLRPHQSTLYERAGFVVASDEFEPPHIGPHYRMELSLRGAAG